MAQMKIILNTSDGSAVSVDVRPDETYQMLKERVQEESGMDLEISQIFYNGNPVASDQNVYETFLECNYCFCVSTHSLYLTYDGQRSCFYSICSYFAVNSVDKPVEKTGRICVVEGCATTSLTDPKKEIFNFPLEADKYVTILVFYNSILLSQALSLFNFFLCLGTPTGFWHAIDMICWAGFLDP